MTTSAAGDAGVLREAQAAADEKPGDRDAIQALYKAQNRLPDFEEAFQEAEDYVHSLVVSTLSAKDGGVVIVGTVRDIIISDEAQALEEYWDDYAAKEVELEEILGERPDLLLSLIHISEPRDQRGSRMPSSA